MNLEERIAKSIALSSISVFSTMLGAELGSHSVYTEHGMPQANDGVVSFIGLAGAWAGTGCIVCSSAVACRIFSQMLLTDTDSVDEEVLDAVGELTNIIIGGVKTDLEPHFGPIGLSLPTVVCGRDFITRSAGRPDWTVVRFQLGEEFLLVKMCLSPSERRCYVTPHTLGQTCTLES